MTQSAWNNPSETIPNTLIRHGYILMWERGTKHQILGFS